MREFRLLRDRFVRDRLALIGHFLKRAKIIQKFFSSILSFLETGFLHS